MTSVTTRPWLFWITTLWFWLSVSAYAWFSYALTAPNLVLSSWTPYWQWQLWMWKTFFNNRELLVQAYVLIMANIWLSFGCWLIAGRAWLRTAFATRQGWLLALVILAPMLIAMNALSYDAFNYMFNAKMVMVYQANPHVKVALDFADDPWVRFMHNVHTPAPYGYTWTVMSLIPYSFGLGKLLLTWLSFRLWSVLSWMLLGVVLQWLMQRKNLDGWWWWVVMLNPFVLIEIIGTHHNDLWMMMPAVLSLGIISEVRKLKPRIWWILASLPLLAFSASIKLATILLVPIYIGIFFNTYVVKISAHVQRFITDYWPVAAACLLFVPLLSSRSQQFHPWYWSWVLVWIPLFPANSMLARWLRTTILLGSFVGFARYIPYLLANNFEGAVFAHQLQITWYGLAGAAILGLIWAIWQQTRYNKS